MSCELVVNRCSCGWQFYAFSKWVLKCPQCKDIINTCIDCGDDISHKTGRARFCDKCLKDNKKILDKHRAQDKKKNLRETIGDICNYDCQNCQFSDCILPADDAKQGELW